MERAVKRIKLESESAPVRAFFECVHAEGADVVIERAGRPLLAIVEPTEVDRLVGVGAGVTVEERAARLRALFGAWKQVDTEALKAYIYEGRRLDNRPPVEL